MTDNNLNNLLLKLGVSDNEQKMYFYGLKYGPESISRLAKSIGLSRPTGYEVANKLEEKGLAFTNKKDYGQKIFMVGPENLNVLIDKQKKSLDLLKEDLKQHLATLEIAKQMKLPKVRFFEGDDALKRMWRETLGVKSKRIYSLVPLESVLDAFGQEFIKEYIKERTKKKIVSLSIRMEPSSKEEQARHIKELRQIKTLPKAYTLDSLFAVFDDKVMMITSKKEKTGLIIESQEISHSFLKLWQALWDNLAKEESNNHE